MDDKTKQHPIHAEHEAGKTKCPKCGSKKVSAVPGRVYVVTTKKS